MYKVIAIIGEAGTGKDSLLQAILKVRPDFNEIISCTTRPMREGEQHGVNYYYYSEEEFLNKVNNNEMLEHTNFNNWYYGTSYEALKKNVVNIGVFNPAGIIALKHKPDIDLMVLRVLTPDKERLIRQLNREANPNVDEIIRRYSTDKKDFENLNFEYKIIFNTGSQTIDEVSYFALYTLGLLANEGKLD